MIRPQHYSHALRELEGILRQCQGVAAFRIWEPKPGIVRVDLRWTLWLAMRTSEAHRNGILHNLRLVFVGNVLPPWLGLDLRGGVGPLWWRK